ncbi:hypothetical protein PVA98_23385, partial [Achromobacter xylosoxidans]|nr:hypothetical protein [Achromobacter xylosoxidans]
AHHPVDKLREVWPDVTARVIDVLRGGGGGGGGARAPGSIRPRRAATRASRKPTRPVSDRRPLCSTSRFPPCSPNCWWG